MRTFQWAFATNSTPPSIRIRRVLVREGLWIVEGLNDYGEGGTYNVVLIVELKDGKWWRDTRYYAEPFDAPEWRAGSGRADGILTQSGSSSGSSRTAPTGLCEACHPESLRTKGGTPFLYLLCTESSAYVIRCT